MKFILTRIIIIYLACFLVLWRILDYPQLRDNAVLQTMSRLTPPMDYFMEFVDQKDSFNPYKLMNCINYHKHVAYFFPYQKAEAYGMMGFCYERLGDASRSIASYKKAITLNSDYFWPYYDLGVIFYHQGQYSQAADYFRQALQQDPIKTFVLLSRSKVYNDVKLSRFKGPYDYLQGLKEGRVSAYILMMDSLNKAGAYDQLWFTAVNGLKEGLDTQGIFYDYAGVAAHMAGKEDMARFFISKGAQLHQQGGETLETYLKARVRFF